MDENRDDEQLSGVLDETHVNLTIFEGLLGARRVRLAGNMCGHEHGGKYYPCFEGMTASRSRDSGRSTTPGRTFVMT